jgi:uncharacterized membrane protein
MMRNSLFFLAVAIIFCGCSREHTHEQAPYDGATVQIEVRLLKEGVPVFYSFQDGKESVHFFVLKVKNEIQSYFDACKECYQNKLRFRYEEGKLICNSCNVGYPIYKLKDGLSGCYPIKMEGSLHDGIYEINKESILKGKKYF